MDDRYARQEALPGFGAVGQQRLRDARVLVIGAGGLGSTVIQALAAAGVGTLAIIDDDVVELSNLHRQHVHGVSDLGRTKVASAADSVAALNPAITVNVLYERLTAANALELFANYDLVVDGSDNFPTRYLANDAAALTGIPLVWGAVSQYGGQISVAWAARGPHYRDLFPTPPTPGSFLTCADGGVLPTTVGVIGSLMATETIKILAEIGTPALGTVTTFDALTGAFRQVSYQRDPEGEPITELIDYDLFCSLAPSLSAAELATFEGDFTLLDVREPWEVEIVKLDAAVLIPLGQLESSLDQLDRAKPVVVYCHHGVRSEAARALLSENGFTASHLAGGIDAWSRIVDNAMARY